MLKVIGRRKLPPTNIRSSDPVYYSGVGGQILVDQVGDHSDFGTVYYKEGSPNILSYGACKALVTQHKENGGVDYDMWVDNDRDEFVYRCNGTDYVFRNNGRNLYTFNLADYPGQDTSHELALVSTVEERLRLYSKKDIEAATRVKDYASSMISMSLGNLIQAARVRRVDGLDFTVNDVIRAHDIWGPSLQGVRGKTVKFKRSRDVSPIEEKIIDSKVTMHVEVMSLSGVAFLVSYVKPLCLLLCNLVKGKGHKDIKNATELQKGTLVSEGFEATEITCDGGAVSKMPPKWKELASIPLGLHQLR